MALAAMILFALVAGSLEAQTGTEQSQATPEQPNRFQAGTEQNARAQQAKETIEKAIAVLVPGGIVKGTPRKGQFDAVIDSFTKGQGRDAMDALEKMTAEDVNLPPADVLMAGLAFAVGDNKSGIGLLEKSAMKYPDYPGVYLSFAQIAINTNRITDASLHADKTAQLIETGNHSPEQKKHFLKQYYEIAASIFLRRKQNNEATGMLDELQAISPNLPFYFFSKAEIAFRAEENDAALQFLKQHAAATESKQLPELTLVDWLQKSGKNGPAQDVLLKTRQQHPKDAATQIMAAQMFMAKEDFANALMALKTFEEINGGETTRSLDMKGRIAFAGLSYDAAAEHFLNLTRKAPKDASSANILALCLIESDDPEKKKQAMQISQRVASTMTGNALAVASLAYIYLKNGELEKAKQLMQRVAMSRQATPEISYFLANWLIADGRPDQAASILKQADNVKGLFLYRSAARKLLSSLEAKK